MAEVADFRGIHSGETVYILGNAETLLEHKEFLLGAERKIGVNASNAHIPADYHVLVDSDAAEKFVTHQFGTRYLFHGPGVVSGDVHPGTEKVEFTPKIGTYLDWSRDCSKYIYVCNSSIWVALQLAEWMGFAEAHLMGFELGGVRIRGHALEGDLFLDEHAERQLQLMGYLQGLIKCNHVNMKVFVTSLTSKCKAFPFRNPNNADNQVVDGFGEKPL
jgi:hypothetical protein